MKIGSAALSAHATSAAARDRKRAEKNCWHGTLSSSY